MYCMSVRQLDNHEEVIPFRFKLLSQEKSCVLLGPITYHYILIILYETCLVLLLTVVFMSINFSALNLGPLKYLFGAAKYQRKYIHIG